MLSQNNNALGIIFPNSYDNTVPELVTERTMASIPFAGRYRMVDFILSSMSNCGITNVSIVVRKNYHSLMDHLGTGREWDMARRHGGLNIVPPFAEKGVRIYPAAWRHWLPSWASWSTRKSAMWSCATPTSPSTSTSTPCWLPIRRAGADITVAYQKTEIPEGRKNDNYTLTIDEDGRVTELLLNDYRPGVQNLDLNIYVLERETLIRLVKDATARGLIYFERDILAHNVNILNVHAVEYTGYVAHICDMKSYFDENMKLLDEQNLDALFPKNSPVYTKIRDDNPTRYVMGSKVSNSLLGRRLHHRGYGGELRAVPRRQGQEGRCGPQLRPDAGYCHREGRGDGVCGHRQECQDHRWQEAVRHGQLPGLRSEEPHGLNRPGPSKARRYCAYENSVCFIRGHALCQIRRPGRRGGRPAQSPGPGRSGRPGHHAPVRGPGLP